MGQDVEEIRCIVGIGHREKKARAGVETCTMLPLARSLGRIGENLGEHWARCTKLSHGLNFVGKFGIFLKKL